MAFQGYLLLPCASLEIMWELDIIGAIQVDCVFHCLWMRAVIECSYWKQPYLHRKPHIGQEIMTTGLAFM